MHRLRPHRPRAGGAQDSPPLESDSHTDRARLGASGARSVHLALSGRWIYCSAFTWPKKSLVPPAQGRWGPG